MSGCDFVFTRGYGKDTTCGRPIEERYGSPFFYCKSHQNLMEMGGRLLNKLTPVL